MSQIVTKLYIIGHPYRELTPVTNGRAQIREAGRQPGSALVWVIGPQMEGRSLVFERPGGLSLVVILPPAHDITHDPAIVQAVNRCRPHGILPHHEDPAPQDIAQVLRRPPSDLAAEVTDYLAWRGLVVDRDTTHLIRRILEHSADLRSVTALSRSMYLSRRALGRRLMSRGLPVPSHWLQLGRLLRLAIRLQNSDSSVFSIACDAGYPDGFSVSNQMQRLVGFRPSQVRDFLGWEWILEEWLRREAATGGLAPGMAKRVTTDARSGPAASLRARAGRPPRRSKDASKANT